MILQMRNTNVYKKTFYMRLVRVGDIINTIALEYN